MSLKSLIENQTLEIDDHHWGAGEIKDWDRTDRDVHLEKSTKYKIDGEKHTVKIKVPLNSERPIKIENQRKGRLDEIPRKLKKEIETAFENETKRERFIRDLVGILENYNSIFEKLDNLTKALTNISKHFDLNWTDQNIRNYVDGYLDKYTQVYKDDDGSQYFITIYRNKIKIGNVDKWTRSKLGIKR